jgi:hypothetical protein
LCFQVSPEELDTTQEHTNLNCFSDKAKIIGRKLFEGDDDDYAYSNSSNNISNRGIPSNSFSRILLNTTGNVSS